ncbi:MAG TPA: peptide deformylase, partial [Casimicrobium sp.]|nr:peptide deformylase [Casimicrobium sp.]
MALLTILEYPDPRLKRIAAPVTEFTPAIKKLVDDMAHTMYEAPGIGLAATQVDVHKRIVVIDVSENKSDLRVFISPEIIEADGELVGEEGCLSVP